MKIWVSEHTFNHPWETVTQAVWRKYPNPHKPEVTGTDVVERKLVNGILHTRRLICSRWGFPSWSQKILGTDNMCYGYEFSEVDPFQRTMTMRTKNLSFANAVSLDEKLTYEPVSNDGDKTVLRQEMVITVKGVPLKSYMESYLVNSIANNAFKGRDAIEWVIGKINLEVEDLMRNYKHNTHQLLNNIGEITETAIKSVDDFSDKAKKSIDDISSVAKKGLDEIHTLAQPSGPLPRI